MRKTEQQTLRTVHDTVGEIVEFTKTVNFDEIRNRLKAVHDTYERHRACKNKIDVKISI